MNKLLQVHKYLICATVLGLALAVLLNIFLFAPAKDQLEELRQDVEGAEATLRKMGVPADVGTLNTMLMQTTKQQSERRKQCDTLMDRYAVPYLSTVQNNGWKDMAAFVSKNPMPTRDMYMREFERIIQNSPMGNLDVSGSRLGLARDSDSEERDRLLLRLWGIETILEKVKSHELTLARETQEAQKETVSSRRRGAAVPEKASAGTAEIPAIASLEPVEMVQEVSKKTTLKMLKLEFLVGVTGPMNSLAAFASELARQDCGFGIDAFELTLQAPPPGAPGDSDGALRLNLKLVSFISLETDRKRK